MKFSFETTSDQKRMRLVRDCRCKYQKEKPCGYEIQKWVGGRKSWRFVTNSPNAELAAKSSARYPHVLIRCNGCGAELVREAPNAEPGA